jgi:xylulokinase
MANHLTIALDCGSTNFKVALFDEALHRLAQAKRPVRSLAHGIDCVELGADEIWQTTVGLIREACQQVGLDASQVTRLSITGQAQTFLLLDERGTPLTPLISWLDRRAESLLPQLRYALGEDFADHCSFPAPLAQMQLAKLLWLRQHTPELLSRTRMIALLPTWLALRLGGVAAIDDNTAAMSGLYSLRSGGYWPAALELCGVQEEQLPGAVNAGTTLLSSRPATTLAGNDQTCGALGNGCRAGVWVATLGTALVAYRLAGQSSGPYHPDAWWGPYPRGGYYEMGVQDYGCAALDWAHRVLFPGQDLAALFSAAQGAKHDSQSEWPFFYPDRMGTASAWVGNGSPVEMSLSVLQGIGFALRSLIYDALSAGDDLQKLTVTGGGSCSDFWLQLLANIIGVPIQHGSGDSLLGAARLAWPEAELPRGAQPPVWFPDAAQVSVYRDIYEQWRLGRK